MTVWILIFAFTLLARLIAELEASACVSVGWVARSQDQKLPERSRLLFPPHQLVGLPGGSTIL